MTERRPPERTRRLVLHDTADVVTRCRDFTRRALAEWQWLPEAGSGNGRVAGNGTVRGRADEAAEDALLMVSEVVANARMHAGGPTSLLLRRTDRGLRIEVTDGSPVTPAVRLPPDPTRPGGHGLLIVERLARAWGSEPVDGGKCVWLELDAPPARRPG
ncbi:MULTISPECIES: ATP-binding protein [unclassified Streptomyces]|uniref:ATP-binding protein n=1 Tax=unclassified Streptomyces TaxID=2593676 RepID=UPI000DC75E7C|nr:MULTISPECIES: ATP-binding protein [unclassified Streptomyces]AWZ08335.1 ATP-binding protein [Streptomyces sp. ICC4]AWZ16111.1 ATP-binding protein [Streptomyces sp. ICC1]